MHNITFVCLQWCRRCLVSLEMQLLPLTFHCRRMAVSVMPGILNTPDLSTSDDDAQGQKESKKQCPVSFSKPLDGCCSLVEAKKLRCLETCCLALLTKLLVVRVILVRCLFSEKDFFDFHCFMDCGQVVRLPVTYIISIFLTAMASTQTRLHHCGCLSDAPPPPPVIIVILFPSPSGHAAATSSAMGFRVLRGFIYVVDCK